MKLYSLTVEGFRRHSNTKVLFSDATFLIGQNNAGKSSILAALKYLLSDEKKIPENEFLYSGDSRLANKVVLTAEFRNVSEDAETWRGFKGRILKYPVSEDCPDDTGLSIVYRKTYEVGKDCVIEMKQLKRTVKECFNECKTFQDYVDAGLDEHEITELFPEKKLSGKLSAKDKTAIKEIDSLYDIDESEEEWFVNPGGIPGNVLSRIPKFLLIPAQDKTEELNGSKGALTETLNELFNDVRDSSENYKKAQEYLEKLTMELDPSKADSEFGIMMNELNHVLDGVFPNTEILAKASLSDSDKSIKPQFEISMQSNVKTDVQLQGTGMIRAAVFALLRYKTDRDLMKGKTSRPLIIGFEEPEIYLHPNAAQQMRDTIYDLASSKNNQIVCTTHSPYMIDISKKPSQVLNSLSVEKYEYNETIIEGVKVNAFTTTDAFKLLQDNDKTYIKMILKIDDSVAKVFFAPRTIIVEGDTEDLLFKETISRMPKEVRKLVQSNYQIIKARGKAVIISLAKYLKSMGINFIVIHDKDLNTPGAIKYNQPILDAVGDDSKVYPMENCIEDVLGYEPPSADKPYKLYKFIEKNWGEDWDTITKEWKDIMEKIFYEEFEVCEGEELVAVTEEN
ncbi:AAA family ATPase [Clostridium butyricum]|uniref:AAA family ATPase n=1 Tax=Clostridium butyricum TaxID=1492 RepID=UPI0013D62D76|nr:AAA family ATPase [Clostridium butyricum]MCQ2017848.1 AAA family ATPase [Clostridium butyricum]MCQ2021674.1 AAA family ATPase [Clostridium butyricum]NFB72166.1 DUF2813 domain-containing protein [Clostridium butyricum]NFB92006.1 DUF2813 domain-containing protein [Clostridium butyricum]UTY52889.1 AAA family ATPase [Clostridium butyricum]